MVRYLILFNVYFKKILFQFNIKNNRKSNADPWNDYGCPQWEPYD